MSLRHVVFFQFSYTIPCIIIRHFSNKICFDGVTCPFRPPFVCIKILTWVPENLEAFFLKEFCQCLLSASNPCLSTCSQPTGRAQTQQLAWFTALSHFLSLFFFSFSLSLSYCDRPCQVPPEQLLRIQNFKDNITEIQETYNKRINGNKSIRSALPAHFL